jgi:hypothetical protein
MAASVTASHRKVRWREHAGRNCETINHQRDHRSMRTNCLRLSKALLCYTRTIK